MSLLPVDILASLTFREACFVRGSREHRLPYESLQRVDGFSMIVKGATDTNGGQETSYNRMLCVHKPFSSLSCLAFDETSAFCRSNCLADEGGTLGLLVIRKGRRYPLRRRFFFMAGEEINPSLSSSLSFWIPNTIKIER